MKKRILALVGLSLAGGLAAQAQSVPQPQTQSVIQTAAPPASSSATPLASPQGSQAAPPPSVRTPSMAGKIGVIQAQAALLGTKDGQRAVQEMNKKLEPTKVALDKKATAFRDVQDKLQRGGNAMADAAKVELNRNIEQMTKAYNRDMQDAQDEAESEQHKLMDDLTGKITKVIDNYAQANGYAIILDVSNPNTPVLYASNSVEITNEIIALYDKTYPAGSPASTTAPSTSPAKPVTTAPKPPPSAPVTPKKQP